jgi:hypothetical protein
MRKEYCSTEAGHVISITLDSRSSSLFPGSGYWETAADWASIRPDDPRAFRELMRRVGG